MRFSHRRGNQLYKIETTIGREILKWDFSTVGRVIRIGVLMIMLMHSTRFRGSSSVWLECLPVTQEAASSNLVSLVKYLKLIISIYVINKLSTL